MAKNASIVTLENTNLLFGHFQVFVSQSLSHFTMKKLLLLIGLLQLVMFLPAQSLTGTKTIPGNYATMAAAITAN